MKIKRLVSYFSLIIGTLILIILYFKDIDSPPRDILLTISGFFLGIFSAYIFSILENIYSFKALWSNITRNISSKDLLSLRENLSRFNSNFQEYLPELSLYYENHFRILKFVDLTIKICTALSRGDWVEAKRMVYLSQNLRDSATNNIVLNDIFEYNEIVRTYDINMRSIGYYTENLESNMKFTANEDIKKLSRESHYIINSKHDKLIKIIFIFEKMLQLYNELTKDFHEDLQFYLDLTVLSTSILGVIGICSQQLPVRIENDLERNQIINLFNKYNLKLDKNFEAIDINNVLLLLLLGKFGQRTVKTGIIEIENNIDRISDMVKYPSTFFYINRFLLEDRSLKDLLKTKKILEEIKDYMKLPLDITVLNISSLIISRGFLPTEINILKEMLGSLSDVNKSDFYYDGVRLNKAIVSLIIDNQGDSLEEIINLARFSNNYNVSTAALKTILKIAAIDKDDKTFNILIEQYDNILKAKGFERKMISKEYAASMPIAPPLWYFLMMPNKFEFVPYKISPWGNISL